MKLLLLPMLLLIVSCSTTRNEVCTNISVWEEKDSMGKRHVMIQQLCMATDDWNRLQ